MEGKHLGTAPMASTGPYTRFSPFSGELAKSQFFLPIAWAWEGDSELKPEGVGTSTQCRSVKPGGLLLPSGIFKGGPSFYKSMALLCLLRNYLS